MMSSVPRVSSISLGLWLGFGSSRPLDEQRAMLRRAIDRGVNHLDVASSFGPPEGAAETNLGRLLREDFHADRDQLVIATKAPPSCADPLASLEASLRRLGADHVDIFYANGPLSAKDVDATAASLHSAVSQGKARSVGLAANADPLMPALLAGLRERGTPLAFVQTNYSLLNRRVEDGQLELLEREGVGCLAFSPLADGLLSDRYLHGLPASGPAPPAHVQRFLEGEGHVRALNALNEIAAGRGQTLAQMAIAWTLRHGRIASALIGAGNLAQLEERLAAISAPAFSADELAALDRYAVDASALWSAAPGNV